MFPELKEKGERARQAARHLATLNTATKNNALKAVAETIMEQEPEILSANDHDIDAGQEAGLSEALLDRLLLTVHRLDSIAKDVLAVATLPDPVGET
ncbi:MAG: gamma-glutamyl-phosphate reductase, partial [Anaerolineae bacterium]